jgi:hypothetical protein
LSTRKSVRTSERASTPIRGASLRSWRHAWKGVGLSF